MSRPFFVNTRLSKEENLALNLWASSQGVNRSTLVRQLLRASLREAASTGIFPADLLASLQIQQESQP